MQSTSSNRNAMVVRADARAIGAITALGAPMRQAPRFVDYRTGNRAGECITYHGTIGMDDDALTTARDKAVLFKSARAERKATRRSSNADAPKRYCGNRITAADLAPIGDQNH